MARVEYTRILPGAARAAGPANAIFDAVAAQSVNIDQHNLQTEGLDYDAFVEAESVCLEAFPAITHEADAVVTTPITYATLDTGTTFRASNVAMRADDLLVIRVRFQWRLTLAHPDPIPIGSTVELRLARSLLGVETPFDGSYRWVAGDGSNHADMALLGWFLAPIDLTLDYVEVQLRLNPAVDLSLGGVVMTGTLYRKAA